MDGDRVYAVVDVVKVRYSVNYEDCNYDDEEDDPARQSNNLSSHFSGVSKRMIEQFLTEVEGPDRDWQQTDQVLLEEDRETLIASIIERPPLF